ncbi:PhnA domain-containing protein [Planktosalinus lacus]|uniref:PhnA protein n=1 Tax=Planktosalinus lacus TaxID=1526573 RepID=A0A8J2VBK5_9FLAO|nr:alkylphosphonate utilization protein [Planktosalinus lacus]GGD95789.1 PhnA protein [Planktosalinus lacus]
MLTEQQLMERSGSSCEICNATENLKSYNLPNSPGDIAETNVLLCETCLSQIENPETIDPNHWRSLNDSMWSTVPAVQVFSWRMLNRLKAEGWPQDLLDMMYLDEETLAWAKADGDDLASGDKIIHRDSNGAVLEAGDTVVLIKDLDVKGSSLTAKRGTAVRRISLVYDNAEQIEGKVEGQQIVILTKFVKKV